MAISLYNIRKWGKMFMGKSILHVDQGVGRIYSKEEIKGYYNDFSNKVLSLPDLLHNEALPQNVTEKGESIYFPVAIFQYGLGAYDLYLLTNDSAYLKKFWQTIEWTVRQQEESGAWNNFFYIFPDSPYGAMAQGEGASLLLRAYSLEGDSLYLVRAKRAIDFMLKPISEGGTTYDDIMGLVLHEYTHLAPVFNGWVFAWFGLYDICKVTDDPKYHNALAESLSALKDYMPRFDSSFWSYYDTSGRIASPFYHKLHIALTAALFDITEDELFAHYYKKWTSDNNNPFHRLGALIKKSFQKIKE